MQELRSLWACLNSPSFWLMLLCRLLFSSSKRRRSFCKANFWHVSSCLASRASASFVFKSSSNLWFKLTTDLLFLRSSSNSLSKYPIFFANVWYFSSLKSLHPWSSFSSCILRACLTFSASFSLFLRFSMCSRSDSNWDSNKFSAFSSCFISLSSFSSWKILFSNRRFSSAKAFLNLNICVIKYFIFEYNKIS